MKDAEVLARLLANLAETWQKYGRLLKEDLEINSYLEKHQKAFVRVQKIMQKTGAALFCQECGQAALSCCGKGMEFECEEALLLANLVLGVKIPSSRHLAKGCFFLGPNGCVLKVRPLICRNFICPELKDALGLSKIRQIQDAFDEEAFYLFQLLERIKTILTEQT
ncbi:hypothetical protein [Thermodesulfatator autotrophicus]|uniref:Uncharacterized protein n=1 Tax=Thermodesulfatator autotrophicus TaxID=1795632 RepID=A0A177E7P8_9BACT|nr:hypothetical protein [Thermodesulfatator autotrophicus]OAG27460.1 hypothetical protein TH606_06870 [Thermodesulfatator autotrophicus]